MSLSHLLLESDGKILVFGYFSEVEDLRRQGLVRLHADGRLDPSFDPGYQSVFSVKAVCQQPDGKAILSLWYYSSPTRQTLMRLNSDPPLRLHLNWDRASSLMQIESEVLPAHPYVLQTSADLEFWTSAQTNLPSSYQTKFVEPKTTNHPARFYRLQRQNP